MSAKIKFKVKSLNLKVIFLLFTFYFLLFTIPTFATHTSCHTPSPLSIRTEGALITTSETSNTKYTSDTGTCIFDPRSSFVPFKIPNYDDLKSLYFDQSKLPSSQKITLTSDASGNPSESINLTTSDKIYFVNGNLTIDSPSDITGAKTGIIFVNGNLSIGPIPSNKLGNNNSSLVFIVKGNIAIASSVTEVNAVLISSGEICTASSGSPPACPASNISASQLVINGSLISLDSSNTIKFRRTLTDNTTAAAEVMNHQSKYLVILRDLMAQTLQKWSEIP